MVDPENLLDPVDDAYRDAEATLNDDHARAARRARVLAGVARIDVTAPAPVRRSSWRGGGWLAAASVVGLSVFVATRLQPPSPPGKPTTAAASAVGARATGDAAPPPAAAPRPNLAAQDQRTATSLPAKIVPPPRAFAAAPPPQDKVAAHDAASADVERSEAFGDKAVASQPPAPPGLAGGFVAPLRAAPQSASNFAAKAQVDPAQRLRAAAASGRTVEVENLLARGVPIDAPDADGDTALMKAVTVGHWRTVAVLRRHGASLDRKNRAGRSVRDIAESMDNDEAGQALGLRARP